MGLCSGEVRLDSGWNIVGQGGECCINSIGISGHPIFSPVFQSSNKLFVADSILQSPHTSWAKNPSALKLPHGYLDCSAGR